MVTANNAQKIKCQDCGKEIIIDQNKNIINGLRLAYESQDKKIEIFKCKECFEKDQSLKNYQACEVYSRVVGYLRPVSQWNYGKQKEFEKRTEYKLKRS